MYMIYVVVLTSPTRLSLVGYESRKKELTERLTYVDEKVDWAYRKMQKNAWLRAKIGDIAFNYKLQELLSQREKCLLFEDEKGLWTYSGLLPIFEKEYGDKCKREYDLPEPKLIPWSHTPIHTARYYQIEAENAIIEFADKGPVAIELACHGKGQELLKYDGTLERVENLKVGDQLMGPDSLPRIIESLKNGRDTMYKLETTNGQVMTINGNHILHLKRTKRRNRSVSAVNANYSSFRGDNPTINITVNDYLKQTKWFKHIYKTYSVPIDFCYQSESEVDPYFVGLYLGDGNSSGSVGITTMDCEIVDYLKVVSNKWDLSLMASPKKENNKARTYVFSSGRGHGESGRNKLKNAMELLGVFNTTCGTKKVPLSYKTGSKNVRLKLLAGLIDSDGNFSNGCYDFVSKSKNLAYDVAFISRSLGFRASVKSCIKKCQTGASGTYWRVIISGDLDLVPVILPRKMASPRLQKKNSRFFGFKLTKISDDEEFYGFSLDGDHLYLTDTFLVTHNTGSGKTRVAMDLIKHYGLQTIVMTPSVSIAGQIYDDFVHHFGKSKVGMYGGGKKEFGKLITISIGASLTRLDVEDEAYQKLSQAKVFISDESHTNGAATLAKVCFGIAGNCPIRIFLSGTQMRNDGSDLLLDSIIGPIVYRKTVQELVDGGFLAKPIFRVCWTDSAVMDKNNNLYYSSDANENTRAHVYYNKSLNQKAAELANKSVSLMSRPVVILVEELEQLSMLLPFLRYETRFAHSGVTAANKDMVPVEHHKSDPKKLVKEFNEGKFPILVGTSCIGVGTDFTAVRTIINLRGGKSEVEISQGVGRGTRLSAGKEDFLYIDLAVRNVEMLEKHAKKRIKILNKIYPSLSEVAL
jgi:superfamily II DNA or RNA helicase